MKYSIWQNLKYRLYYSRAVAHLHADLARVPAPVIPDGFFIREIDIENDSNINYFIEIISDAYNEFCSVNGAVKHFTDHLFLKISNANFLCHNEKPIATVSIGTYKANDKVGGDARWAVKSE